MYDVGRVWVIWEILYGAPMGLILDLYRAPMWAQHGTVLQIPHHSHMGSTYWTHPIRTHMGIGRFQAIKTDVLLIFSFITGDKSEFLSPMMFSNEYITGI